MQVAPTNHDGGGNGHGGGRHIRGAGDGVRGGNAMNPEPFLFVFKCVAYLCSGGVRARAMMITLAGISVPLSNRGTCGYQVGSSLLSLESFLIL